MYQYNPRRRTAPGPAPLPNWSKLAKNDHVEVRFAQGAVASGTIDMIAADRSVFWLIRSNGAGRVMVCLGDDVSVTKAANAQPGRQRECSAA
ncbi:hypothetical protein [Pseudarthrobacter sp. NamE5]|uniref:hypothetical protein n=1 Tax=Pseudarthrobacter sp. NamE5 TaxID=2576839 RepID=UPI00110A2A89|nr:hypothetical protein [Pseudarthrobacter sp. NamE5]TLM88049.1 hypothetical protein FDW84_00535 [Pseudarthrobacter sp. NamE5]